MLFPFGFEKYTSTKYTHINSEVAMKISRSFALYVVMLCLVLLGAASAWSQSNFNIKIYATDGSGWTDSVYIGKYTTATDAIGDSLSPVLNETELPPLPPDGANQAPDIRILPPGGGLAYGQGVRVDVRNLVSDGQKNVYRLKFRRTDPEGTNITLSWPAGLGLVSGGGFYLTDGTGLDLFFPAVNMAEQTSFTSGLWSTLSGGIVEIVVGDGSMHRTFTATEIATAADQKGKVGKYEKAKPISVDFQTTFASPVGGADQFYVEFDKVVEGTVSFPGDPDGHLPINISGLKKYTLSIPSPVLAAGVPVVITGNGNKGKIMKGKFGFQLAGSKLVKTAIAGYDYQYLRLPAPNINNIGDEMYLNPGNISIGMGPGIGLPAQIGVNAKGKPIIHHISIPKWKDVTKTLYKFKNVTILQNGPAYCLDTINSKENIKMLKALGPDKTVRYKGSPNVGNKMIGNMLALKFNMAASQFGHTPAGGFRDLVYTNPGHAFDGQTVDAIADSGDKALACYGGLPLGWTIQNFADFLDTVNGEFSGAWDTVSWSGVKTVATGIKPVVMSGIFTSSGPSYAPVAPADYSSLYEVPKAFSLSQNYPNPFNPTTTIEFSIPEDALVTLRVYNMLGQVVATLADREEFSAGENWVELDGAKLSTGVYYYQIVVNDGQFQDVQKMVLMK
jgi:hypothetical protein